MVSFMKIKLMIDDVEKELFHKNQQNSNNLNQIMHSHRKEDRPHPPNLLIASQINRIDRRMEEKFSNMREAFRAFDIDSDGDINLKEFKHGLKILGIGLLDKEAKEIFTFLDVNNNGSLSYVEFA